MEKPKIYEIGLKKVIGLDEMYSQAVSEVFDFYGLKSSKPPMLFIVPDRKTMNELKGFETENWLVGFSNGKDVFLLDRDVTGIESRKTIGEHGYFKLMKHEISHCCYSGISQGGTLPLWLNEGVSLYVANQLSSNRPVEFKTFLDHFKKRGEGVYSESGFVVQDLIENFGKSRLIELIRGTNRVDSPLGFFNLFRRNYGFDLSYESINNLRKVL